MKKIILLSLFIFSLSLPPQNPGIFLNTINWSKVDLTSLFFEDLRTCRTMESALTHPALAGNLPPPTLKRNS
jgi:hypothetical protein